MSQKRKAANQGGNLQKKSNREASSSNCNESSFVTQASKEAEVGIIESITLKNFMCHKRLEFRFNPNINFVVGKNGSGKSAILTAVVIGLGGKASITSRGQSIKQFILNGKQSAEIILKLRNRGEDAFKHDLYGDTIIVERKLTSDGSTTYQLKNEAGNLVSKKRDELINILDQFNIQVENPISILNQEVSRNFLNSSSPHDKYKFFLKATQLEQMERDYRDADEEMRISKVLLEQKEQALPELEKSVQVWKKKYRMHQTMADLREKIERLKDEATWAQVTEKEQDLEKKNKQFTDEKQRSLKFAKKVEEFKKLHETTSQNLEETKDKLVRISSALEMLNPQRSDGRARLDNEKKRHRVSVTEHRKLLSEIGSIESDRNELLAKIKELRTSPKEDTQNERAQRLERIQKLTEEKESLEARCRVIATHMDNLRNSVDHHKQEQAKLNQTENEIKHQLEGKKRSLQDVEASKKNHLRRFGNWVPELLDKIENAFRKNRFHEKPRGPIGACIKLRDPKWALAVETVVKGLLLSFCCHDFNDERVLEELMSQVHGIQRRPTIITSKFQKELYKVGNYAVRLEGYHSVLDLINFQDPVVANCCIDQRGIESILLIDDNKVARDIMSRCPPANCREAFTLIGDQIFPAPNYRYYSCTSKRAQFLQTDVNNVIVTIQEELKQLERQYHDFGIELKTHRSELQVHTQSLRSEETKHIKLRQHINGLLKEISELKNVEEPDPVDVTTLEEEVAAMSRQLEELEMKKQTSLHETKELKATVDRIEKELQEVEEKIESIVSSKLDPLKYNVEQAEFEKNNTAQKLKHYETQKKDHDKLVKKLEAETMLLEKSVEEVQKKAERICQRVNTRRTAKELDKEIDQYTQHLVVQEQSQGSREEVAQSYLQCKDHYDGTSKAIGQLRTFVMNLRNVMKGRHEAYERFRRSMAMRVHCVFTMLLSGKNFHGKIEFDHERKQLNIHVQPLVGVVEDAKDLKSLSGGERSYSTVCFILSLWEAMDSPFRILDEFDVFMDMVTRRISMDLMLTTAQTQGKNQFLFLTPQNMSALPVIQDPTKVTVFKMHDPIRNQSILPYETSAWSNGTELLEETEEGNT